MPMEINSKSKSSLEGKSLPLWSPSEKSICNSHLSLFRKALTEEYGITFNEGYRELWQWSINNIPLFWSAVWKYSKIIHSNPPSIPIVNESISMDLIPEWFSGARLNFSENLLSPSLNKDQAAKIALISINEGQTRRRQVTYEQLYHLTSQTKQAMEQEGVEVGNVIAAYAGNEIEVIVCMLAAASLGAIFTTIPPDFGPAAVKERLSQTMPKLLFASSSVFYNGKKHDQMEKIKIIINNLPSIKKVILIDNLLEEEAEDDHIDRCLTFDQFIGRFDGLKTIDYIRLPFNHPLYILYSSGTTGKPKCLVHSAGGTLIQHLKEHLLHNDLRTEDIILQYTTIGWMMWHWMVSTLAIGCTIILYDGSPFKPDTLSLLRLVQSEGVTHFGTSAKYIQHLQEQHHVDPTIPTQLSLLDLSALKTIFSTGSPLSPSNFNFVYDCIKRDIHLASITGGTDIISLFAGSNPFDPVYAGEIQAPCLGMAVSVYSEEGLDISSSGQSGDLICTRPFPSMPIAFWNDPSGSIYHSTYFDRFPSVWHHGDYCQFNPFTGGLIMLGRSDATLNPAGVRFGSAELYNIITTFGEVEDCLVVGVRRSDGEGEGGDERVFMFLKLINKDTSSAEWDGLVTKIRSVIRNLLSPRHVPAVILPCPIIPYTVNGKKVEVAVKRILSKQENVSTISLACPSSLDFYRQLATDPKYFPN